VHSNKETDKLIFCHDIIKYINSGYSHNIRLFIYKSNYIDAYITSSINPFKNEWHIYLSEGTISKYDKQELEFIIAHEVGHLFQNSLIIKSISFYISKLILGNATFLSLLYDVCEEEKCADNNAVDYLIEKYDQYKVFEYCSFLAKYEADIALEQAKRDILRSRAFRLINKKVNIIDISRYKYPLMNNYINNAISNITLLFRAFYLNEDIFESAPRADYRKESIMLRYNIK